MMLPECSLKAAASISNLSLSLIGNPILKAISMALIVGHGTPLLLKKELLTHPPPPWQNKDPSMTLQPTNV
jgi:hypothetical protein